MEALLASFGMVAIAEIGDKTQLLSFVLAARFAGQHGRIIAGIFVATVANHFAAAFVGDWAGAQLNPDVLRWVLGLAFLAFAAWALIPDTLEEGAGRKAAYGAFATTVALFFLAEMGDKTQLATVALSAQYDSLLAVTLGTTLGMMAANVPAVLLGERLAQRFPLSRMRFAAAALFAAFGALILLRVDLGLGLGL
jgi:putative Ca2+/H+ antiporter (TMEM165/GDT1 family)